MIETVPTPKRGSLTVLDNYAPPWPETRRGSLTVLDPYPFAPPKRGFRHVGLVRGARG